MADRAERHVVEQPDHAGPLEERAEQDEKEDVGRRHIGRHAIDALGAQIELVNHLAEIEAAMHEESRQLAAEQRIGDEDDAHQRQRPAHDPPRALEHQQDDERADHEIDGAGRAGAQDEVALEHPVIEAEREAEAGQQPVVPGDAPAHAASLPAEQQEGQQQQEADMHRAQHDRGDRAERRGEDLEEREGERDQEDRARREALELGRASVERLGIDDRARRRLRTGPLRGVHAFDLARV
jgi:hypothetical protein